MFLLLFLSLFRCLEENQWDYNKALTAFNFLMVCVFYALHLHVLSYGSLSTTQSQSKVPPEAFI